MEFSLESVRAHWRTTVLGGVATVTMVIVTCTAVMGVLLGMSAKQSAFFGAAVSLSSTTVVAKCLRVEDKDAHHGRVMMGTLVVQDVLLGLFLALVPALANPQPALIVRSIVAITGKSVVFLGFSWLFARMIVKPFARCFRRTLSGDSIAAIAVCFLFVRVNAHVGPAIVFCGYLC